MNTDILQPLLGLDKSNPLFELLFNPEIPNEILVHFGTRLLETVHRGSLQEKLLLARLYNSGFNCSRLSETFKHDRKTIKYWGGLLKSGAPEDLLKIASGRKGSTKITDDRLKYIEYLYDKHYEEMKCHTISFIKEQYIKVYQNEISYEAIRLKLQSKINKKKAEAAADKIKKELESPLTVYEHEQKDSKMMSDAVRDFDISDSDPLTETEATICEFDDNASTNICINSKRSPQYSVSTADNFPMQSRRSSNILSCYHVGILLSRFLLDFVSDNLGGISNIVRQWIAMILCGCQNIEQGQQLDYRALELFIGKQEPSALRQRDELKAIASRESVNSIFTRNIRMVKAEKDSTFLLDPHGVPYYGRQPLLKCWLGGSHTVGKGYYLDLIHTTAGEPVFSTINDNYYDLRQRLAADIKEFRKILGGNQDRTLTFIIDRAVFGVEFMKEIRYENIHIITWEKNYKRGEWDASSEYPVKTFYITKYRNSKKDTYTYTVQYFKRPWEKETSFAQYIVCLTKPHSGSFELSIINTDYDYDEEKTIKPILTRWIQENDIGYLILLGINQITSYLYESYEDIAETLTDRMIENKEHTKLTVEKLNLKKQLGLLLVNREIYTEQKEQQLNELEKDREKCRSGLECKNITDTKKNKLKNELKKLNAKISRLPKDKKRALKNNCNKQTLIREKIKLIDEKLKNTQKSVSRIEKLIREEYVRLNFMPKSFMDAIKLTARNIIYQMLQIFRPIWNNYRNDITILRELISSMGHIEENKKNIVIKINPSRNYSKKEKHKILLFLLEVSNRVNRKYNIDKIVIFSMYEIPRK